MKQIQLKQRMLAVPLNASKSVLQAGKCLGVKFKKKLKFGPIVEHSIYALIPYTIISLFFFLALLERSFTLIGLSSKV